MNIDIKVPFDHRSDAKDIKKEFKQQADILLEKLPYFEYINIATKIVKTSALENIELGDVRNGLMKEIPEDLMKINIYLTSEENTDIGYVQTNDRKFGVIHSLKTLDEHKANEILSFFILKILNIYPNSQILSKSKENNIKLSLPKGFFKNEIEIFQAQEIATKRKIILTHLAATGWLRTEEEGLSKMKEYEDKSIKEIALIDWLEKPVDPDYYQQLDFPLVFKIALFFTFYTPFLSRFAMMAVSWAKYKIKGKW